MAIDIAINDTAPEASPVEPMSGQPWTRELARINWREQDADGAPACRSNPT